MNAAKVKQRIFVARKFNAILYNGESVGALRLFLCNETVPSWGDRRQCFEGQKILIFSFWTIIHAFLSDRWLPNLVVENETFSGNVYEKL